MRLDSTPVPATRPAAAPPYLRELARVREIDLAEALGAERLEALLHQRAPAGWAARRWLRVLLPGVAAVGALAVLGLAAALLLQR